MSPVLKAQATDYVLLIYSALCLPFVRSGINYHEWLSRSLVIQFTTSEEYRLLEYSIIDLYSTFNPTNPSLTESGSIIVRNSRPQVIFRSPGHPQS